VNLIRRLRGKVGPGRDTGEVASIYVGLRDAVINLDPSAVGIHATAELPNVWGLVFDWHVDNGIATVVYLADGTTSLYVISGGGSLGAGEHPAPAAASRSALKVAESVLDQFPPVESTPLPGPTNSALTVLTFSGPRRIEQETMALHSGPLAGVADAMQQVIGEIRRAEATPNA